MYRLLLLELHRGNLQPEVSDGHNREVSRGKRQLSVIEGWSLRVQAAAFAQYVHNQVLPADRDQAVALHPAARDAKAAVRWLYANAATYQINTDYVTAMGGSAGAYLAPASRDGSALLNVS